MSLFNLIAAAATSAAPATSAGQQPQGGIVPLLIQMAPIILGFIVLHFRQGLLDFAQTVTGQQIWDPSIRFLTLLPSKPEPVEIIGICLMGIGFSFLSTLYPAFRAANTDPVEVLRYE